MKLYEYFSRVRALSQEDDLQFEEFVEFFNIACVEIEIECQIPNALRPDVLSKDIMSYGGTQGIRELDISTIGVEDYLNTAILYKVVSLIQQAAYEEQEANYSAQKATMFAKNFSERYSTTYGKNTNVNFIVDYGDVEEAMSALIEGGDYL